MDIAHTTALVVGGSTGVGRELALRLAAEGVDTTVVARTPERLEALHAEEPRLRVEVADASSDGVAPDLLARVRPDLIVLAGGARPRMAPLSAQSWADFSAPWHADTKIAFEFARAALGEDLPPGATVVMFASGAALNGSPQSGGYAGAKRMQHLIANYAQVEATARGIDVTFQTVYPNQLIAGTDIAREASTAYATASGRTPAQFMDQWERPLTPERMADAVLDLVSDRAATPGGAWTVSGADVTKLP